MKKFLAIVLVVVLAILFSIKGYAITWTKDWSSSDDGKTLNGSDIEDFQKDVSTQVFNPASVPSFSGSLTNSGNSIFSGMNSFTGAVTCSTHVHLSTIPAGTYKAIKVGSFTKDVSLPSASVSYTGVGFKPTSLIVFNTISGTSAASWSLVDATTAGAVIDWNPTAGDSYQVIGGTFSYSYTTAVPAYAHATLTSFDSDGFTLYWDDVNNPVGTMAVAYIAFKK